MEIIHPGTWLTEGQPWSWGLVCSLHRPLHLFSNEGAAKISIKLPETLKFPHSVRSKDGEGSQLLGL